MASDPLEARDWERSVAAALMATGDVQVLLDTLQMEHDEKMTRLLASASSRSDGGGGGLTSGLSNVYGIERRYAARGTPSGRTRVLCSPSLADDGPVSMEVLRSNQSRDYSQRGRREGRTLAPPPIETNWVRDDPALDSRPSTFGQSEGASRRPSQQLTDPGSRHRGLVRSPVPPLDLGGSFARRSGSPPELTGTWPLAVSGPMSLSSPSTAVSSLSHVTPPREGRSPTTAQRPKDLNISSRNLRVQAQMRRHYRELANMAMSSQDVAATSNAALASPYKDQLTRRESGLLHVHGGEDESVLAFASQTGIYREPLYVRAPFGYNQHTGQMARGELSLDGGTSSPGRGAAAAGHAAAPAHAAATPDADSAHSKPNPRVSSKGATHESSVDATHRAPQSKGDIDAPVDKDKDKDKGNHQGTASRRNKSPKIAAPGPSKGERHNKTSQQKEASRNMSQSTQTDTLPENTAQLQPRVDDQIADYFDPTPSSEGIPPPRRKHKSRGGGAHRDPRAPQLVPHSSVAHHHATDKPTLETGAKSSAVPTSLQRTATPVSSAATKDPKNDRPVLNHSDESSVSSYSSYSTTTTSTSEETVDSSTQSTLHRGGSRSIGSPTIVRPLVSTAAHGPQSRSNSLNLQPRSAGTQPSRAPSIVLRNQYRTADGSIVKVVEPQVELTVGDAFNSPTSLAETGVMKKGERPLFTDRDPSASQPSLVVGGRGDGTIARSLTQRRVVPGAATAAIDRRRSSVSFYDVPSSAATGKTRPGVGGDEIRRAATMVKIQRPDGSIVVRPLHSIKSAPVKRLSSAQVLRQDRLT